MASNRTATLSSLLSPSSVDDDEENLKQANAELKKDKSNQQALHTRVVALIKLDRFEDALHTLNDVGEKFTEVCALEKAYALYKIGQLKQASGVVERSYVKSRGLRHVRAQVAYREEKFEDAGRIYKDMSIQDTAIEGEENDLRINRSAVDAQLIWQGNGEKVEKSRMRSGREDLEAFETAYNAACGYIARGDLGPGSLLLKRARDLCEALDELSEEEKKAEVLPIMVQQAFVFTRLGKFQDAEALQKVIIIADVPESPTRLIAQNNAIAAKTHLENPYLIQRLFDSVPKLSKTERLFEHQASIMQRNRYAVDLQQFKYDGIARSTAKILSQNPSPTTSFFVNSISALNTAAYIKCGDSKSSLKQVSPLLEKRPTDVGLIMTIIQLYILTSNPAPAIVLLESFFKHLEESLKPADQDVRYAPGLVALIVSLYRLQGRKMSIRMELGRAAEFWRQKSEASRDLLRAAGISLLESSRAEDVLAAGEIFDNLFQQDHKDSIAIAGLVASKAAKNLSAVQAELDKLTPIDRLISGIDTSALESAGLASLPVRVHEGVKKRMALGDKDMEKVPRKKIRKSKMPKDFEQDKKLDSERWLPMKDRSSYRPKGRKGKKKALEATQGGVIKEEESLELVGGAGAVKVEKAPMGTGRAKKKKGKK